MKPLAQETDADFTKETFLETYASHIAPKLKDIDVFVKTAEADMKPEDVAHILGISVQEVREIMARLQRTTIDRAGFFQVMARGDSAICALYQREVACGSPYIYTPENIAYIYDVALPKVAQTCERLRMKEVTAYTLPILFSHIYA